MKAHESKLLEVVQAVLDDSTPRPFGICEAVHVMAYAKGYETEDLSPDGRPLAVYLLDLMSDWPEHSGKLNFPVPHPTKIPVDAYREGRLYRNMFDPDTDYGAARLRLLAFIHRKLVGRP